MSDDRIASIVRALAQRVDPGRVLRDVLSGAVTAAGGEHGVLAAVFDSGMTPLVTSGAPYPFLMETARRAAAGTGPARMSDPGLRLEAVGVPVRLGSEVVAALAVAGRPGMAAPAVLQPFADVAALALAGRPGGSLPASAGGVALAEALATVAQERSSEDVFRAALDVAEACFGVRSAFVCFLDAGGERTGGAEVACYRGLDRQRLAGAAGHPEFARLLARATSPTAGGVAVVPPTDPVVQLLTEGAEFAVCLSVDGGAVVLLKDAEPDPDQLRALNAYRLQVAAALRGAHHEAEARAARDDIASVVHAVPDPALAVDAAGCFVAVNVAAAELFALSEPFEIGRPARGRLGHPELEAMLLGEAALSEAEVALGRPQSRRWRVLARAIGGQRHGATRLLLLREVTRARRGEREESDFVAAVGRELRTPAQAIRRHLAALTTGAEPAATLAALGDAVGSVEALADQLTLLSGGRESEITPRPEPTDVVGCVRRVVDDFRAHHPDRGLIVTAPARLASSVDAGLLDRAVRPLLDNALRYSDGPVALEVADRGDTFEVAVIDTGPGIFSGDVPGLFERFHPLDGSPARHGAGLGLYSARRVVEAMGGRIWCDSRLGIGSRFAFRLPHGAAAPAGSWSVAFPAPAAR